MSSHEDDILFRLSELERLVSNLIRYGTVDSLDAEKAVVRVKSGDLLTGWLKWLSHRAGPDADWWAPEPGEQVLLLSPSGDPMQGIVLPAIYSDQFPAPADVSTRRRVVFADGGYAEYDRESGALDILAKGPVNLTAAGEVSVTGKATVEIVGADGAAVKGIVQGDCLCAFTGAPHPMISSTIKGSV